jgi:hypothetical protein
MLYTNRSLWIALMACVVMAFFARNPQFSGLAGFITLVFISSTIALSVYGIALGIRGYRLRGDFWALLAPIINALVLISFLAFCGLYIVRVGWPR